MRAGVIVSSVGLGATILMLLMTTVVRGPDVEGFVGGVGLGVVTFFIGLGLLLNALLFTRPRKGIEDHSSDARAQNLLDAGYAPPQLRSSHEAQVRSPTTSNLAQTSGSSVTEQTTQHLKSNR